MTTTVVSPMANVHSGAQIGAGVRIDPFATVHEDVVIGDGTHIHANAVVQDGARIGKNCRIFPGAIISTLPQDLKYQGEYTTTEIGDGVTIREFATINRGTSHSGKTVIKTGALIMAYVHVAHDCHIGQGAILANGVNLAGHIQIEDHARIGGMSAIHQFVRVGKLAMVGGGSLVGKDVPPYVLTGRYPLRYSGLNSVGLKRFGFNEKQRTTLQEIYRVIFMSGLNLSHAIQKVEEAFHADPLRDEVLAFVRASERGLCKGFQGLRGVGPQLG